MTINKVFLDTAYAIALAAPNDQHHARAANLAERLETERVRLITTRAVALEIGKALANSVTVKRLSNCCMRWNLIREWKSFQFQKTSISVGFDFTATGQIRIGASPAVSHSS